MIILRFAPSPTGDLHVGSLRTALLNFLLAKHLGGKFFLRIDDTDEERNVVDVSYIEGILSVFGITYYQSFAQSQRKSVYDKFLNILLDKGAAFYCTCSQDAFQEFIRHHEEKRSLPKTLCPNDCANQNIRNGAIRLKVHNEETSFQDEVLGLIKRPAYQNHSFVLRRENDRYTYMFATVIDDIQEEVTHIVRACDHVDNTHKQLLIAKHFNYCPTFYHVPLMLTESKTKLSKRDASMSVTSLLNRGFLPKAILQYIFDEKPIDEARVLAVLKRTSNFSFDTKKLSSINKSVLRSEYNNFARFIVRPIEDGQDDFSLLTILPLVIERSSDLLQMYSHIQYLKDTEFHKRVQTTMQEFAEYKRLAKLTLFQTEAFLHQLKANGIDLGALRTKIMNGANSIPLHALVYHGMRK